MSLLETQDLLKIGLTEIILQKRFYKFVYQGLETHHKIVAKTQFSKQKSQFCIKSKQLSKQIFDLVNFVKRKRKAKIKVNAFERKPSDIFAYLRRKIHVPKLTCARVFFFVEKSVRSSPRTTLTTFTSSPSAL